MALPTASRRRFQIFPSHSMASPRAESIGQLTISHAAPTGLRGALVLLLWPALAVHHALYRFQQRLFMTGLQVLASKLEPGTAARLSARLRAGLLRCCWAVGKVGSRQSGQWAVGSGQWAVGSGVGRRFAASSPLRLWSVRASKLPKLPPTLPGWQAGKFPRVSGGHNMLSRRAPAPMTARTSQTNSTINLNSAIRNFASGHEARARPQRRFPKRRPSSPFAIPPGPQKPLETPRGILPRRLAAQ
jgi:hypothetical protein